MIKVNRKTIWKISIPLSIAIAIGMIFFATKPQVFAACPSGCISGGWCEQPYSFWLDCEWQQCLPDCIYSCTCGGRQGWCTCGSQCEGCGCTPPACPAGYTETNTYCATTTTSCTKVDSCNDPCGGTNTRTCYQNPVYTGAPATPSATYLKVNTTVYTLSTNSGAPTNIPFPVGASVTTYTTTTPSNGGYIYNTYNALSGGTLTTTYTGTTREIGVAASTYTTVGRVQAQHYVYRCTGYTGSTYSSGVSTGYFCNNNCSGTCTTACPAGQTTTNTGSRCLTASHPSCTYSNSCSNTCSVTDSGVACYNLETNLSAPSAPSSVQMRVGTVTYTLSTNPSTPTQIKVPRGDSVQLIVPTISGADGYRYVVDNYGVNGIWTGGTACSGVAGEDFCVEGSSATQTFTPSTKTVDQVLTEAAKGKVTGYGYTNNDCDYDKKYSTTTIAYYEVELLPTSSFYQIQVNTNETFTGTTMWDSGKASMSAVADGARSSELGYAGSALAPGVTYYWRIRFWDETNVESPWSAVANFKTTGGPNAPTNLRLDGNVNPTTLGSATPTFTATHTDPNLDNAVYYEVEVNTSSTFTGTVMWDSGKQSMVSTPNNTVSPGITYAGTPLQSTGDTYYWRIRFWDTDDLEGAWSATANFQSTFAQFRFEGLKLEGLQIN